MLILALSLGGYIYFVCNIARVTEIPNRLRINQSHYIEINERCFGENGTRQKCGEYLSLSLSISIALEELNIHRIQCSFSKYKQITTTTNIDHRFNKVSQQQRTAEKPEQ